MENRNSGTLCGIGTGTGDPELLTLKAVRMIKESDVVILPSEPKDECYSYITAKQAVPEIDEKEIICCSFPMTRDADVLNDAHDRFYALIEPMLDEGKKVVFLTIGDPTVYSTFSYIRERALAAGRKVETVSGIPSFCAAAARLGISLGDGKEEIHILQEEPDSDDRNIKGTRIYMKSGKRLMTLKEKLIEEEKNNPALRVYSVSNCGMESEILGCSAKEITTDMGYLTLVIVKEK